MVREKLGWAVVALSLGLVMTGCAPDAGSTPPGDGGAAQAPGATTQISSKGIEPYVVGASADALKSAGSIGAATDVAGCPGWTTADAAGPLAGAVKATFHDGKLAVVEVHSGDASTVDGATLGMSVGELSGIYSGQSSDLAGTGGAAAIVVPGDAGNGLLFHVDTGNVSAIDAGSIAALQGQFTKGKVC